MTGNILPRIRLESHVISRTVIIFTDLMVISAIATFG